LIHTVDRPWTSRRMREEGERIKEREKGRESNHVWNQSVCVILHVFFSPPFPSFPFSSRSHLMLICPFLQKLTSWIACWVIGQLNWELIIGWHIIMCRKHKGACELKSHGATTFSSMATTSVRLLQSPGVRL
jgi:hypothetical protein